MTQDVTTPVQIEAGRECNVCAPGVVRCAHFDGKSVVMQDWGRGGGTYWARYKVCSVPVCDGATCNCPDLSEPTNVRAQADAIFDAAELRLLAGEPS